MLTPESISYMLAMFVFERTADVQNGPLFCFRMCWTECVGKVGSGGSCKEDWGGGVKSLKAEEMLS